jgi:ribosomal protein L40E
MGVSRLRRVRHHGGCAAACARPQLVDSVVWGRHLIHLICLRCNRANAPEAKFCSECGAGLLRKFCGRCRVINDAESHFCQSCGEALPAQSSVPPAPPPTPPAVVPDLTDVYADFDAAPRQVAASPPHIQWADETKGALPVLVTEPAWNTAAAALPSRRTVLFGFVGGAAVLLAVLLWARSDHAGAPPVDALVSAAPAMTTPASAAAVVAVPAPAPTWPSAALDGAATPPESAGSTSAAARPPATPPQASKTPERRLAPEALIAAQPPAAGPAPRNATPERRPVTRSAPPPSPALECTPQVDALGLCVPGAKVADKSGSR